LYAPPLQRVGILDVAEPGIPANMFQPQPRHPFDLISRQPSDESLSLSPLPRLCLSTARVDCLRKQLERKLRPLLRSSEDLLPLAFTGLWDPGLPF
jgi:hypothetical protein